HQQTPATNSAHCYPPHEACYLVIVTIFGRKSKKFVLEKFVARMLLRIFTIQDNRLPSMPTPASSPDFQECFLRFRSVPGLAGRNFFVIRVDFHLSRYFRQSLKPESPLIPCCQMILSRTPSKNNSSVMGVLHQLRICGIFAHPRALNFGASIQSQPDREFTPPPD